MGHASHFLSRLDRVSLPHVELALSLYNDVDLVKFVLKQTRAAESAERIAISLDDPEKGPFVIVTREGRFVTCLAAGMLVRGVPTVERAQLDEATRKRDTHRAQVQMLQDIKKVRGGGSALMTRIFDAGEFMSREEMFALRALTPLVRGDLIAVFGEAIRATDKVRSLLLEIKRPNAKEEHVLKEYWLTTWSVMHMLALLCDEGPELIEQVPEEARARLGDLGNVAGTHGNFGFMLRGVWATARLGAPQLPALKAAYFDDRHWGGLHQAGYALMAMACRHPKLDAQIREVLSTPAPEAKETLEEKLQSVRSSLGTWLTEHINDAAACIQESRGFAQKVYRDLTDNLGGPCLWRRGPDEEVPDDLAIAALIDRRTNLSAQRELSWAVLSIPLVVQAPLEDLYFPLGLQKEWSRAWTPQQTLGILEPWRGRSFEKKPLRAEATPGRNDPCHCGSGKKYKKCHGA